MTLSEVSSDIQPADLLLFRGGALSSRLIGIAGRSRYSHAAMVVKSEEGQLQVAEVREWYGGRIVSLWSQVQKYSGRVDWYRTNPGNRWPRFSRQDACKAAEDTTGCEYGWMRIGCVALMHMPVTRLFYRPSDDGADIDGTWPPYCSNAVSSWMRAGGQDPVPTLEDRWTEPADLSRSLFFSYEATLIA